MDSHGSLRLSVDGSEPISRPRTRRGTRGGSLANALTALSAFVLLMLLAVGASGGHAIELLAGLVVMAIPFALVALVALLLLRTFVGNLSLVLRDSRAADVPVNPYTNDRGEERHATSTFSGIGALAPEQLRREYIAGALSHTEFRDQMVAALKQRVVDGRLSLPAYERELDQLIRRARAVEELDGPTSARAL